MLLIIMQPSTVPRPPSTHTHTHTHTHMHARTKGAMWILWGRSSFLSASTCVDSSLATEGISPPVTRCSLLELVQTDSGAHPDTCPVGTTVFVQRLEPDPSRPYSVEAEEFWIYASTPLTYLLCYVCNFLSFVCCSVSSVHLESWGRQEPPTNISSCSLMCDVNGLKALLFGRHGKESATFICAVHVPLNLTYVYPAC
jgi:hypothetical protein